MGRGLPREGVGAKKFDTSLETREIPEKFEKKRFGFNSRPLKRGQAKGIGKKVTKNEKKVTKK